MIRKLRKAPRIAARRLSNAIRLSPARARAWWVRTVVRGPVWFTDRYGITCRMYPGDNLVFYFAQRSLFDDVGTVEVARRLLRPGMTVLDVGASIGAFTLHAARLVSPGGHVHAFEPTGRSFERLQENLTRAPQLQAAVTANRAAIFNAEGDVALNVFPPEYAEWNSLGKPTMLTQRGKPVMPTHTETVPAYTIDAYCERQGIARIGLLKIDVEGFEVEALEGARAMVGGGRVDHILFEVSLQPLTGTNRTARDVIGAFVDCGLRVSRITPAGELVPIADPARFEAPFFANYLAAPK